MVPSLVSYLVGLALYATHFPECYFPGRFDWGGSHAMWHVFIVIGEFARPLFSFMDLDWAPSFVILVKVLGLARVERVGETGRGMSSCLSDRRPGEGFRVLSKALR